jgi:hypothetical protein
MISIDIKDIYAFHVAGDIALGEFFNEATAPLG